MRLINNELMTLEWYMAAVPEYAILSHTWDDDEVTYQDFVHQDPAVRLGKKGFGKIEMACRLALQAGVQHTWVDTCCIDKTSSAELSEAINSMFHWYRQAAKCFVWLADLAVPQDGDASDASPTESQMAKCRWVSRGWTLQELIAPATVEFYDSEWNYRGSKSGLSDTLAAVTGISADVLCDPERLFELPVAQRMSWAASRTTTRQEDMAYCLLGIFDVSMPMLYGEGSRAFIRLQEEIARETNDLSLLAWRAEPGCQEHRGVLAESPAEFRDSGLVENIDEIDFNPEFSMTNKGVRLVNELRRGEDGAYLMTLRCSLPAVRSDLYRDNTVLEEPIGIWVQHQGGGVYSRVRADQFGKTPEHEESKSTNLHLIKRIAPARSAKISSSSIDNAFRLRRNFNEGVLPPRYPDFPFEGYSINSEQWDSLRQMFLTRGSASFTGHVLFAVRQTLRTFQLTAEPEDSFPVHAGQTFVLVFGLRPGERRGEVKPWVTLATHREGEEVFGVLGITDQMRRVCALQPERRRAALQDDQLRDSRAIMVTIEEEKVDGNTVFNIDLELGPI